jgi:SAM-dependent methyltransferase
MRKLNLGCGFDKRDGFINADGFAACAPDVLMDIETTPWPFEDDAFDYILMKHVLEHVGAAFADFRRIMRELYRVCAPGGRVEIHVPHFRHDTFWADPTHVRAFTPLTFEMMSKRRNDDWIARRANITMLAYALGVDFETDIIAVNYDPAWMKRLNAGEITLEALRALSQSQANVIREIKVQMLAVKPWSGPPA